MRLETYGRESGWLPVARSRRRDSPARRDLSPHRSGGPTPARPGPASSEPLEVDREEIAPPPGLWADALVRVAEHQCRKVPLAPAPALSQAMPRHRWRTVDFAVAASILICVGLLIPAGLGFANRRYQEIACRNNLRMLGTAFINYRDLGPEMRPDRGQERGSFPNPAFTRALQCCRLLGTDAA